MTEPRPRLLFSVTVESSALRFLEGQLRYLSLRGWETHLICSPGTSLEAFSQRERTLLHPVQMARDPSLLSDAKAWLSTIKVVHRVAPQAMVCGTPKAALLGLLTGKLLRVPHRVHLVHGLRYEGASGVRRRLLVWIERITANCATELVAVSPSVRSGLLAEGIGAGKVIYVLGSGSPNGVDTDHFTPATAPQRAASRDSLGVKSHGAVALFVGRLTRDKGLRSLLALADALDEDSTLLIVGEPDPQDTADQVHIDKLTRHPRVILLPHTDNIRPIYQASDLLVLPTRREGLPTVVIEAAACAIPTVAYGVTGVVDSIESNNTGVLIAAHNTSMFVDETIALLADTSRRRHLGRNARELVLNKFSRPVVWDQWSMHLQRFTGVRS